MISEEKPLGEHYNNLVDWGQKGKNFFLRNFYR